MRDQRLPIVQFGFAVVALLVLLTNGPQRAEPYSARAEAPSSWPERQSAAAWLAQVRPQTVSFAVVDAAGQQVAAFREDHRVPAASTFKALVLAAYLRQPDVANRELTASEEAAMRAMITWSSNDDASRLLRQAGWPAVEELAQAAGMQGGFVPDTESWGLTQITAASMAQYFHRMPSLLPERHRAFAMGLFADLIPGQQWGMPAAAPEGWAWFVKGGWISTSVHQVGAFAKDGQEFTVAVTVEGGPGTGSTVSSDPDGTPAIAAIEQVTRALFADGRIPGTAAAPVAACGADASDADAATAMATWSMAAQCRSDTAAG